MTTSSRCKLPALLGAVVSVVLLVACGDRAPEQEPPVAETPAETPPETASSSTASNPCPAAAPCGDDCSNQPFVPNDCWTTPYGPAKADIVISPTNMLYCPEGAYALCFFSGPPNATGSNPANKPLPCVMQTDGTADCTCQVYTSGPSFVDLNGILNQGAFYETVQTCGQDGSGCANLKNCGEDGSVPGCANQTVAPVCQYVQDQNPDDPSVSLMPGADLISTFSFAMEDDYPMAPPTSCPDGGLYAGCMTAPCNFAEGATMPPSDGDPIQCKCPTYDGPFEIGQPSQACTIPTVPGQGGRTYVWSASHTVTGGQ